MSYPMSHLWSEGAPAPDIQVRDTPDEVSTRWLDAPASPFVRCTKPQWVRVVSALYAALHLTPPSVIPPQHLSLTEVVAVIWRAKAFRKQIPPKGPISFTPVCPLVWKPGLCDLCGSPLYRSEYGWPNRWRCDACILAMNLALGFLEPDQWLTGAMAGCKKHTPDDREGWKEAGS